MKPRKWNLIELDNAVKESFSIRQVLVKLGLRPAGGNYVQIQKYFAQNNIDTSHFLGKGWNITATNLMRIEAIPLQDVCVKYSNYQSHKLKNRLFKEKLKTPKCEQCSWSETTEDGRIPLELHHMNGVNTDNRLENLQILCPNCHSLKASHRGRNIGK